MKENQETVIEFDKNKNEPIPIRPGKIYRIIVAQDKIKYKPLSGAHFDLGKSFLRPSCMEEMGIIKELLLEDEESKVMIFGHTDISGKASKNRELALRRAKAMKAAVENKPEVWMELLEMESWGITETQHMLKTIGYSLECTGKRTKETSSAISSFREENKLSKSSLLNKDGWELLINKYIDTISPKVDLNNRMVNSGEAGVISCGEANPMLGTNGREALNRRTIVATTKKDLDFPCDDSSCPALKDQGETVEIFSCKFYRENIKESTGEKQIEAKWSCEKAREGDTVSLIVEGDITDGTEIELTIFEEDSENSDEMIINNLKAVASGGKAEAQWCYQYFEDEDDIPEFEEESDHGPNFISPGAYNPPEYFFIAKAQKSEVRSPLLNYNTTLEIELTDNSFNNEEFILYHSKGATAGNLQSGKLVAENVPPGSYQYIIKKQ